MKGKFMRSYLTFLVCLAVCVAVFSQGCEPENKAGSNINTVTTAEPAKELVKTEAKVEPAKEAVKTEAKVEEPAKVEANATKVEPETVEAPAKTETAVKTADSNTAAEDKVLVTVNGLAITQSQVDAKIKPQLDQMAARGSQVPPQYIEQMKERMKKEVVDKMVIERLLDEKVKEANIDITDEDATKQLQEIASQQQPPISMEDLKALIEARGQTFDEVKGYIRKGLGYQKVIEAQFGDNIKVTDEDANKFYTENQKQYENPEQIKASHILIKVDSTDPNVDPNVAKAAAKAKADDLLKQIREGADFATLAQSNSACPSAKNGGDLGFFSRGQMVGPFEETAFGLKTGQVSEVVETKFGYHIIKATDHKDANTVPFEQAKADITKQLGETKKGEIANKYVESLKAGANVVYAAEPNKPKAVEPEISVMPAKPN
jgi:peptidyl-prolyl cis-trans isomerase C